ncbi:hypothetical protein [Roseovarius sp. MMSF_3281]|uniref:hypothetical protein n=1 Tax=Roseovarius sp. MMSF_3281 TaxID=3046694 RepID=UPI00273D4153|nr:hypothetical protein [Roseovarius sp. MMSF_3281]
MTDDMDKAAKVAFDFEGLMKTAAHGAADGRGARDCENKATAAMKVGHYIQQTGYWGGPPPTLEEAQKAAFRAWGDKIPTEITEALF